MTNHDSNRLNDIDQRLDNLTENLSAFREQQEQSAAKIGTLERLTSELLDIARLHQQALRTAQLNAERDRAVMRELQGEVRELQTEVRGILEYLFNQQRNGNGGTP